MELVYLWIEEYKNIKNQGFNFSPKFKCEYNSETNVLKIEENENYVNIFPENINVTAIVGKNGAGKSSLLEFIMNQQQYFNGFFVFLCDDIFYIFSHIDINNILNKTKIKIVNDNQMDFNMKCRMYSNLIFIKTFVDINKYNIKYTYMIPLIFFRKTEKIDLIADLHKSSVELWNIFKINSKKGIDDKWDIEPFSQMTLDHYFMYLKEKFYNIILLNYSDLYPIIKKYFKINKVEFSLKSLGDIFMASPSFKDSYKKDSFLSLMFELYNKENSDKKKLLLLFLIFSYLFNDNLRKEILLYVQDNELIIEDLCDNLFQKFDIDNVDLWKKFINSYLEQYNQNFEKFVENYLRLKKI